jgi:hypothetical protein
MVTFKLIFQDAANGWFEMLIDLFVLIISHTIILRKKGLDLT